MPKLFIIIPVFNEGANINKLINSLCLFHERLVGNFDVCPVFIDDCSQDNTVVTIEQNSKKIPIKLLKHESNRGPGAAFATGFEFLKKILEQNDLIVTMEGDNTSNLDTLQQMIVRRLEGYDVVLASPYTYGGGFSNTSWFRLLLSHCANGLAKIILGIQGIQTLSSFFRLYNADILNKLYNQYGNKIIESNGFEGIVELLFKLIQMNATISEVPMKVDKTMSSEKSKMKIMRTIIGYFSIFMKANKWRL